MNILVSGGSGFIGTHLINELITYHHSIVNLDLTTSANDCIAHYEHDLNKPLDDFEFTPDLIIHLAAKACIRQCNPQPRFTYFNNVQSTFNLCEFALKHKAPLIYVSSSNAESPHSNIYGCSKSACEDLCGFYHRFYGLPVSIVRPFNVYGPGSKTSVINLFEKWYKEHSPFLVTGTGEQRRDYTHVSDVVRGIVSLAHHPFHNNKTYQFGTGTNHSLNEIVKLFGVEAVRIESIPGELESTLADTSSALLDLGWVANVNLIDYIKNVTRVSRPLTL